MVTLREQSATTGRTWPEYPFRGNRLDLDGLGLHYLDEGAGPPVVMVHGNPTWSYYYRRLVLALRDRYRCIVPDHIGCGYSDKPDDLHYDYHFDRRASDLGALIDRVAPSDPVTLVVHDWGGMIGLRWATRNPDRVRRFVVLNTGAFHLPAAKRFPLGLALSRTPHLGALLVRGLNLFALGASYVGCKRRNLEDAIRDAYVSPYRSWADRRAVHRFVQDIPLAPSDRGYAIVGEVADGLARFAEHPMQIHWGLKDFVFDRHFLAEWQRRFPKAETHAYDDAGHYVLEDAPERVIPAVRRFLEQTDRSA
ncbi:MAG: alpha/beta fold hydrolase [Planctomycetes bacterium]|nr:alpha/beta fold hydrolase [Planctomycetota bacterium]